MVSSDTIRDKLRKECKFNYRGWEIVYVGGTLRATKSGCNPITVPVEDDIKGKNDEYEDTPNYEEEYRGWIITKDIRKSNYEAKKIVRGNSRRFFSPIAHASLSAVKSYIDNIEDKLEREEEALEKGENFSKEYNGWTITISSDNSLVAKKDGKTIRRSGLKDIGLESTLNAICSDIDSREEKEDRKKRKESSGSTSYDDDPRPPEGLYDYWKGE